MGWYKLVFKQKQPIHVGSAKWGVVNETEIFIPGSTMWGALTNIYLQKINTNNRKKQIKKEKTDTTNRKELEEQLKKIIEYFEKISNFFPSFDGENILQPTYQKGEFGYLLPDTNEFLSEDKFRFYFVDTLVQTAIEPISRQAKDESLHELDYILPKSKQNLKNFKDNLYWIGIIQIKNNDLENFLDDIKSESIFAGADVRYGYGELKLVNVSSLDENDKNFWWINNSNSIEIKTDKHSPYFIEAQDNLKIEGEVLLIPEIDFRENTPKLTDARFFSSVGSKIQSSLQNLKLKKGKLVKENNNANST